MLLMTLGLWTFDSWSKLPRNAFILREVSPLASLPVTVLLVRKLKTVDHIYNYGLHPIFNKIMLY